MLQDVICQLSVQVRSIAWASLSWQPLHAVRRDLEAELGSPPGQFRIGTSAAEGATADAPLDLHRAMLGSAKLDSRSQSLSGSLPVPEVAHPTLEQIKTFFCTGAMANAHWYYIAQGQIRVCAHLRCQRGAKLRQAVCVMMNAALLPSAPLQCFPASRTWPPCSVLCTCPWSAFSTRRSITKVEEVL